MAQRILTALAAVRRVWAAFPAWAQVGAIYAVGRFVTAALVVQAARAAPAGAQLGEVTPLRDIALAWDAQWYWLIAEQGYPDELPLDPEGAVAQNPWAFMPVFPFLAKSVGVPFGSWGAGAAIVSLAAGYAACLLLLSLIRMHQGRRQAMWAVTFFSFGPLAALFHIGYAETLFLAELFAALLCVLRRRWAWLYLLVPLMAFTRPGLQAFALMLAIYGIRRWLRRREDPLPSREILHIVTIGLIAAALGFAWQAVAGAVTGRAGAYLDTELAWRRSWVGTEHFVPVQGWFEAADVWFAVWGLPPGLAPLSVVALVVAAAGLFLLPAVRRVAPELRIWGASHLVYLLLVFFPQSSVFRLLAPLAPVAAGAAAVPARRGRRWIRCGLLTACVAGQWAWIWFMWGNGQEFWQVP
ncbi:hypothetical protein [Microbacterium halophytorum]|uniref:hypothetical protein n=1 Tax=Microbacterium halophytorum TaxID=2067568 RepID=UPI001E5F0C2D|nr:hypothetical protein [Microbacterium halophytorum]